MDSLLQAQVTNHDGWTVYEEAHSIADHTYRVWRHEPWPSAEVVADRDDGLRLWINTQYGAIHGPHPQGGTWGIGERDTRWDDLAPQLLAATRSFQQRRHAREAQERERAEGDRLRSTAAEAQDRGRMPADVAALFARYGSSDGAWDAQDEGAWALMREWE